MSSLRPVRTIFMAGLVLGGFSACSSVFLNAPVSKNAEGWVVTLSQVKQGPDEYVGDYVQFTPDKGERFVWTILTVKNELGQEQTFSYEACRLEGKGASAQPMVVDRNAELNSAADNSEAYEPGQERTRKLIFRFPGDQRPTRMKCGAIVLPIPASR